MKTSLDIHRVKLQDLEYIVHHIIKCAYESQFSGYFTFITGTGVLQQELIRMLSELNYEPSVPHYNLGMVVVELEF